MHLTKEEGERAEFAGEIFQFHTGSIIINTWGNLLSGHVQFQFFQSSIQKYGLGGKPVTRGLFQFCKFT